MGDGPSGMVDVVNSAERGSDGSVGSFMVGFLDMMILIVTRIHV